MKKVLITMKVDVDLKGKGYVEVETDYDIDQGTSLLRSFYTEMGLIDEVVEEPLVDRAILDMLDFWRHYYENEQRKIDSMMCAINKEMKTRIG